MENAEPSGGRGTLNVTVVEARPTVGGRIYTKRGDASEPSEGYDLGAMWIHDWDKSDNPVKQLAALLNLTTVDVDLLSLDTGVVQPLRACCDPSADLSCDPSAVPCTKLDDGDPSRNEYRASRRCIHMLLEAAQNSLDSSFDHDHDHNLPSYSAASLQDAIDVVKGFANMPGVNPDDRLTVTDGRGTLRECAEAAQRDPQFEAVLEHHIAVDVEHRFGGTTAELDAKWYNYRLFDGKVFPPLLNSIDARYPIDGSDHPMSRGGYGAEIMDTSEDVGYKQHSGSSHIYYNTQTLIEEGYDHIVNSILAGQVNLSIHNSTHPQWEFGLADGVPDPISVELNSPVTKITRICAQRGASHCIAAEYVVERETPGGGRYSSMADVVIMAVPLGVLQQESIELLDATSCTTDWDSSSCNPENLMPAAKRQSIGSTGFGNFNKVVLHYDDPCGGVVFPGGCQLPIQGMPEWNPSEDSVKVYGLARPGDYARGFLTRWIDITHVVGHPALVGYATGLAADVMETAPRETVMAAVDATLRRIFGGYAEPVDSEITRWGSDNWVDAGTRDAPGRYAQGAMPHWKPGNTFATWDDIAAPIDNSMFFTGDHVVGCSDFPGYRDRDGDTCEEYDTAHYCTPMGTWGIWGVRDKMNRNDPTIDSYAVDGVSALEACCACGGGIKRFGSMSSALGTTHGALMAGRNTALDVMHARDKVVMPTAGGDRPRYDCEDDTDAVLFEWRWQDPRVSGSCEWFRTNPWACRQGAELLAVSPEHWQAGGDYTDSYVNVNADDFGRRGPRAACPIACGTCPPLETPRACDAFPCKSNSICRDQVSHPEEFTDQNDYSCDCGLSGYTGKNCDEDYRECDEEPCRDENGLSNGICYDSVSAHCLPVDGFAACPPQSTVHCRYCIPITNCPNCMCAL